jgi:hypothetical protein
MHAPSHPDAEKKTSRQGRNQIAEPEMPPQDEPFFRTSKIFEEIAELVVLGPDLVRLAPEE